MNDSGTPIKNQPSSSFASPANLISGAKGTYHSEVDDLVTLRSISVLPIFDNLRGIYARPIEDSLVERLKKNHVMEYSESKSAGPISTPDELEENVAALRQVLAGSTSDAVIAGSVIKGPSGVSMKFSMFLRKDEKLFAQEQESEIQSFDLASLIKKSEVMIDRLLKKIPYQGVILSRQNNRVTINLGTADGITTDQILSVIQVIKLNRHPRFNFLVNAEKEILGKVKILKVDDTLSFGVVITEREVGAIQANAKIENQAMVTYAEVTALSTEEGLDGLAQRPDGQIAFGKNPGEWVPMKQPTFGAVGARLGLGQYTENVKSTTSLESSSPFYPSFIIDAEIWMTPKWTMHATAKQGIITTDNPSGGSPSDLAHSLSSYELLFGYTLRLGSAFNAPKAEFLFGFSTYRLYVDDTDDEAITTKQYGGLKLGLGGSYPMPNRSPYSLGANLYLIYNPKLSEDPNSSGNSNNQVNQFGFFVDRQMAMNLKARFNLDFELYSSDFSGGTVTSSSQKHTVLSGGVYYLF